MPVGIGGEHEVYARVRQGLVAHAAVARPERTGHVPTTFLALVDLARLYGLSP